MTREEIIREPFDRTMRLIELGPSYSPIVPKSDGWRTTVVDHGTRDELVAKYGGQVDVSRIEAVDIVWRAGNIADAFAAESHGTFDGLIASHVGEHLPDPVGFLQAADRLLAPHGIIALALPDKRVCFDALRPVTMTGDWLEAHRQFRDRHSPRNRFNFTAYAAGNAGQPGWLRDAPINLQFLSTLEAAYDVFNATDPRPEAPYEDAHAWVFTPCSFQLLIVECNALGLIPWLPTAEKVAPGTEFYVWLGRRSAAEDTEDLPQKRMRLLRQTLFDLQEQIQQWRGADGPAPLVSGARPGISAAAPLQNGATFIRAALDPLRPALRRVFRARRR